MKESVNRRIPLPGVSPEAANAFVFVLYTGSLPEDVVNQPLNHAGVLAEMMCLSHRLELYGTALLVMYVYHVGSCTLNHLHAVLRMYVYVDIT